MLVGGSRRALGRAADAGARLALAEPARRVRVDLVAPGHARDLLAREEDEVQDRRHEADRALDATPERELSLAAMCHGARL
jgi:hypothetical protein